MTNEKKRELISLLDEYQQELNKKCDYDCYNCEMGILENYSSSHSCAIDVIVRYINYSDLES